MQTPTVKHLLIDLGDVLYKIDISRTLRAFAALAPKNPLVLLSKSLQHPLFSDLETGKIDMQAFVSGIREQYALRGTDEAIAAAWNALLIGLVPGRTQQIKALSKQYDLALLSNTNAFHRLYYQPECEELFTYFDHLFFSYEMGQRKPDAAIFKTALTHMNWRASETLFVDDSKVNIEAAKKVGLQTFWVKKIKDFDQMFERYS